jgi:uncharacterized membrane protein
MARVRARIGRSVSHPHAISVTAHDGHVSLSGPVLAHEADRLLSGVSSTPGVKSVENALSVHTQADDVPSLQGGRPRTGDRPALMQTNWPPTARLLVGLAGGALMANCLARRDPISVALGTVGFGMFMRSATNMEMKTLLGFGRDRLPIKVQKTININAPVEHVFGFWTDHENFPRFMTNVREVSTIGNGRSQWKVAGPMGVPVKWAARITENIPNERISWETLPGSLVKNSGTIHFQPTSSGGTQVDIKLLYNPIVGAAGHALAKIFAADPKSEMDADLLRMKTMIETGHAPHDAAQPMPPAHVVAQKRAGAGAGRELRL